VRLSALANVIESCADLHMKTTSCPCRPEHVRNVLTRAALRGHQQLTEGRDGVGREPHLTHADEMDHRRERLLIVGRDLAHGLITSRSVKASDRPSERSPVIRGGTVAERHTTHEASR